MKNFGLIKNFKKNEKINYLENNKNLSNIRVLFKVK